MTKKELFKKINFRKLNGLVPVVTQDFKTNKVLMLAFVTREALKKTLNDDKMTYWSRGRKKLWTKGETSGHFQLVKEIWLNCESDSLLIKVKQIGNVCHTGNKTCFFKKIYEKRKEKRN
ncbi:MAG: phosphoribosyl-AMP cyclohydrolase [Candidatus Nealsonbacteria bacterium]|nr:phosphoribosyl-AMP cyclohydrolase [Candidatus Nealsonbacteria bacterium]